MKYKVTCPRFFPDKAPSQAKPNPGSQSLYSLFFWLCGWFYFSQFQAGIVVFQNLSVKTLIDEIFDFGE